MILYSTFIFDLDGLLRDSEIINITSVTEAILAKTGIALNAVQKSIIVGRHPDYSVPKLMDELGISERLKDAILAKQLELYVQLSTDSVILMPDVEETIDTLLARRCTLALVTSSRTSVVKNFLTKTRLDKAFSIVITADDVAKRKPHPLPYRKAIDLLQVRKESSLVSEDTAIGVQSARSAGVDCAAIPNEYTRGDDFSKANYILKSVIELLDMVAIDARL